MKIKQLAVALATGAVILTGCQTNVSKSVLFIGDSITQQSADDITDKLVRRDYGYLPIFNAVAYSGLCEAPNNPASYFPDRIKSIRTKVEPETVFINLGTNDVQRGCANDYGSHIDSVINAFDSNTPIFWTTIRTDIDPNAAVINSALRAAVARHPNLQILDYDAHFRPKCNVWCNEGGADVHLSIAGQIEYAKWIADALDARFPGAGQDTTTTSTTSTTTTTIPSTTTSTTSTSSTTSTTSTIPSTTTTTAGAGATAVRVR